MPRALRVSFNLSQVREYPAQQWRRGGAVVLAVPADTFFNYGCPPAQPPPGPPGAGELSARRAGAGEGPVDGCPGGAGQHFF